MSLCWVLLLCSATSVLTKATPLLSRDDVSADPGELQDALPEPHDAASGLFPHRDRREINSRPSNIVWVHPLLTPGGSKVLGKDVVSSKIFNIRSKRRMKRAFPSTDAVADTDLAQWQKKTPKTEFITARDRTDKNADADTRTNEVEPSFRPRSNQPLTNRDFGVDSRELERPRQPQRRIIYYASLPEITSRDRVYSPYQRRYEPGPQSSKYPRESHVDTRARSHIPPNDRYPYRPAGQTHSYTIVDAEGPRSNSNYNQYSPPYQGSPDTKYNKIPAPYRQNDHPMRSREPLGAQGATLVRSEPYRDYNPRQPAPWSVQIGTKLTVKDDGRPYRPDVGQRRFYVNSQEPLGYNRIDRSRYNYPS